MLDKRGMVCYYTRALPVGGAERHRGKKKIDEKWKKFLTMGMPCDTIKKLSARAESGLYLVNWITQRRTKHLGQLYGLFKIFVYEWKTANENSWVNLLDKLFKTWFEALRCFRYHFLRVWSWLRTNAGGVPNTCKSNGVSGACFWHLVANGWVTREKPAFQWGTTVGNDC